MDKTHKEIDEKERAKIIKQRTNVVKSGKVVNK